MDSIFTHALLDFDDEIIKKYRWTKKEYEWYIEKHPKDKIIKLDKPERVSRADQKRKELDEFTAIYGEPPF